MECDYRLSWRTIHALPQKGMTSDLYDASKNYWDRFVLVKKMNPTPIH